MSRSTMAVVVMVMLAVSVPVSMASTRTLLGEEPKCDPRDKTCCKVAPYTYCNPATYKCEIPPACKPEECKTKKCDAKTKKCVEPECDEYKKCPGKQTCDLTKYQCVKPAKEDKEGKADKKKAEFACNNVINNQNTASNVIGDITTGGASNTGKEGTADSSVVVTQDAQAISTNTAQCTFINVKTGAIKVVVIDM